LEPERVTGAVESLGGETKGVFGFACDLAIREKTERLAQLIGAQYGTPDIIINNAGYATYRTFEEASLDEIERLISVNLMGAVRITKCLLAGMIKQRRGQIVNIASIAGAIPLTPNAMYCVAKHGLNAWSKVLSYEVGRFGIKLNLVCLGRIAETRFFEHETFKTRAQRQETQLTVPMPRVVDTIIASILDNKRSAFVPAYLAMVTWLSQVMPFFFGNLPGRLMEDRVATIYATKNSSSDNEDLNAKEKIAAASRDN